MSVFRIRLNRALRLAVAAFPRARSGQVALTFALVTLPVMFATAAAIDYGRRNAAKTQLDTALDGAVLAVMSQKTNTIPTTTLQNMETQFRAEAAKVPGVTVTSFAPGAPVNSAKTLSLTATYTATVKTSLASMMQIPAMPISGTSSATRNTSQYINYYLLLDNSPSMGLAATDADVSNMKRATNGCAFACHQHTFDNKGKIIGDDQNDFYHVASRNNIKLRIQVLRDAVSALVDQANVSMLLPQQFQMEMWTFNDSVTQTRLQAMTPTLNNIKTATPNIDIAYAYYNQSDNQTDFERAIAKMNATIPASGDGLTPDKPIRFLFMVTDGVEDTGGSVTNQSAGFQIQSNRFIGPLSPSTCTNLKNKNVKIGIIYTQYLPIYDNDFYNSYVRPYESKIGPALQACASDGMYFPVTTNGDITAAMLKLFSTTLASVRLSN